MDKLLQPDIGLMFWTALNFLILAFLLAKFAWKPVMKALDDRERKIKEERERGKKDNLLMEKFKVREISHY